MRHSIFSHCVKFWSVLRLPTASLLHFQFLKAAELFRKESRFLEASENFEKGLDFMRAVDCLLQSNLYDQALNIVARCQTLTQKGNEVPIVSLPRFDQRYDSICYQAAEYYLERGQLDLMTSALEKLPESKDRITFLKKNSCYEQAAELLLNEGKAQEAAKMMRSHGKFLEATLYTEDVKFAAQCYLLAARTVVLSKENKENASRFEETQELIEAPLRRAAELYERCGDLNGQADVKFIRGEFYGNFDDLNEAGRLYNKAVNYAGVAECFLLLMEGDSKHVSRPKALLVIKDLLRLIFALHKNNQGNMDRTAVSMCEYHFGLMDTEDPHTREVPRLEMVRFTDLQIEKQVKNDKIDLDDACRIIKEHLHKKAATLLQQVWDKCESINNQSQPCSRYLSGTLCNKENCKHYHGDLTVQRFANRFYALDFLIKIDAMVAKYLKELKRESARVTQQLRHLLEKPFEFKACQMLEELLFPRRGQLGQSYVLEESDFLHLRQDQLVCDRIIEYAKFVWHNASQEERWSDSNLFIRVSNLMHVAAAAVGEIFDLLSVEERNFERKTQGNVRDFYGFFIDERKAGCFKIFSQWFERSKDELYRKCDILKASHSAIKIFLFTSAKRNYLPNTSTTNAVMIIEFYITACLMLYSRLMMNDSLVCLPASYLSLIRLWDIVNRSNPNQLCLRTVIRHHTPAFEVEKRASQLDGLRMETESMVKLMFGVVSEKYNIFSDTFCDRNADSGDAERVLILALTMLCNSGHGIPKSCESLIRQEFLRLKSCKHLPNKLRQCIKAVRESSGLGDVVNALQDLLSQKPRQDKLFDVKWDKMRGREVHRNCQSEFYPQNFRVQINVDEIHHDDIRNHESKDSTVAAATEDLIDDFQEISGEDETYSQGLEDKENEEVRKNAYLTIGKAILDWAERKRAATDRQEKMKNDPVECHFKRFKLDRSGCTICGTVQFDDCNLHASVSSLSPSSSHDIEETNSNWQPRILKQNTFNSHCSRGSPHWKKEKQFEQFKEFYRKEIFPNLTAAQHFEDEMKVLRNNTEIRCSLDLDRLQDALSRLQSSLKKVEKQCAWDNVQLLRKAVQEIIKTMKSAETIKNNKGR